MANEVVLCGAGGSAVNAGLTRYYQPSGGESTISTEATAQFKLRNAGTLSKLWVYVGANTVNEASTFRSRIETADGNLAASITGLTTGAFSDDVNSDSTTAGNKVCFSVVAGATGTSVSPYSHSVKFVPSTYRGILMAGTTVGSPPNYTTGNTYYMQPLGKVAFAETEANASNKLSSVTGTWRNLQVNVATNTCSVDLTIRTRVNAGDGSQSLSITSSTTGFFEDTSGTDAVATTDTLAYKITSSAGSGSAAINGLYSELDSSTGFMVGTGLSSGNTVSISSTRYAPFGHAGFLQSSEIYYARCPVDLTAKKLRTYISANTVSATSTLVSRINLAVGGQSVSITASTTGWFEDSSGTDSVVANDLVSARLVTGGSGTSLTMMTVLMDMEITAAVATGRSSGYVF